MHVPKMFLQLDLKGPKIFLVKSKLEGTGREGQYVLEERSNFSKIPKEKPLEKGVCNPCCSDDSECIMNQKSS